MRVLEDISLGVSHAETVVLLGTNGNGKSTLMKCVMGMVRPSAGSIVAEIDGTSHDLIGRSTEEIVDLGIALVPEGRRLFPKLTVEENLLLGAFRPSARGAITAISNSATKPSRACWSGGVSWPAVCRAASSRCWRWGGR